MKPFNLKEALAGKPVVTREGQKLASIFYDPGAGPEIRLIGRREGQTSYDYWSEGGTYTNTPTPLDLFMAPSKKEAWVNVYKDKEIVCRHDTKEEADHLAQATRIACCRIEWEE